MIGGTYVPLALIAITQVIVDPLSADVVAAICLFPFFANTSGILEGTTVIPVSSTL